MSIIIMIIIIAIIMIIIIFNNNNYNHDYNNDNFVYPGKPLLLPEGPAVIIALTVAGTHLHLDRESGKCGLTSCQRTLVPDLDSSPQSLDWDSRE